MKGPDMMTAVLDRITGRFKQRKTNARELVEQAAKAIAAGQAVDESSIETALFDSGLDADDLRRLAGFYVDRRSKLADLEKLGAARRRVELVDQKIAAENGKFSEYCESFKKRMVAMREESDAATHEVETARSARDWLLDPKNCPPSMQEEYRAALGDEQTARVALGDQEREVRRLRDEIKTEDRWIEHYRGDDSKEIRPSGGHPAESRLAAGQAAKLDEHERRRKRLSTRLVEVEKLVAECQKSLTAAEAVVAGLREKILKA